MTARAAKYNVNMPDNERIHLVLRDWKCKISSGKDYPPHILAPLYFAVERMIDIHGGEVSLYSMVESINQLREALEKFRGELTVSGEPTKPSDWSNARVIVRFNELMHIVPKQSRTLVLTTRQKILDMHNLTTRKRTFDKLLKTLREY